jgi:hypothetical protein
MEYCITTDPFTLSKKSSVSTVPGSALYRYDQLLLEEPKTVCSPALSLCATSDDSFFRTTEPDGRIARPLPKQDRRLQDQTSQSARSAPLPPLCHADLPVFVSLQVPLVKSFPEYTAGPDVAKYILWRFMQANRARFNVYSKSPASLLFFLIQR